MFGPRLMIFLPFILEATGNVNFNSMEEICCLGNVYKRDNVMSMCCGSRPYNTTEHACCGSNLYPFPSESRLYFCCAESNGIQKPYDYVKQICCDGNILDVVSRQTTRCCNGKLFSEATHLCCDKKLVERNSSSDCCGGQLYNKEEQTCCQRFPKDVLTNIPETKLFKREGSMTQCCGWERYDPTKETCCNDAIKPLPKIYQQGDSVICCMDTPYLLGKEQCCEILEEHSNGVRVAVASKVHDKHQWTACCGLETYDYKEQVCCDDNSILTKREGTEGPSFGSCCAGKVIPNTDAEICYHGQVVPRSGYSYCANDPYSVNSEFCCGDKVLEQNPDVACCSGRFTYLTKNETCCGLTIGPISEEDKKSGQTSCCF